MKLLNLFRASKQPRRATSQAEIDSTISEALWHLKRIAADNHVMQRALYIASMEGDATDQIKAFCEDYSIDQVDEVRRIDVMRHALKLVARG